MLPGASLIIKKLNMKKRREEREKGVAKAAKRELLVNTKCEHLKKRAYAHLQQ